MDCFPDFCLGCDSQAVDGLYCSETCRMNDIERSASTSSSPVQHSHGHHFPQGHSTSSDSSSRSKSPSATQPTRTHRSLSASSSRSSLHSACSSETSQTSTTDISADDARALQGFFNAFDRSRYEKRRPAPPTYSQWGALLKMNG